MIVNGREYQLQLDHDMTPEQVERFTRDMEVTGCLFPDSHCPDHGSDRRWAVLFRQRSDAEWEELTEAEIVDRMEDNGLQFFLHTSEWDHWCEDIHKRKHY